MSFDLIVTFIIVTTIIVVGTIYYCKTQKISFKTGLVFALITIQISGAYVFTLLVAGGLQNNYAGHDDVMENILPVSDLDAHVDTVLLNTPPPAPVTQDSRWRQMEDAYRESVKDAIEHERAIPDEGMEVARIEMWAYNRSMAEKLGVKNYDGMDKEVDIARLKRWQDYQHCRKMLSERAKATDPRTCFPPWSSLSVPELKRQQ